MPETDGRVNILGLSRAAFEALAGRGAPSGALGRLYKRAFAAGRIETGSEAVARKTAATVAARVTLRLPAVERVVEEEGPFGTTAKALLRLDDGQRVECVRVPVARRVPNPGPATLCVSSQAGGRKVVVENVSLIDLLPTIHHYFAGRPQPGAYAGISLLDLLAGKKPAFRERVLFAEASRSRVVAAVLGNNKLIYNPAGITPTTPLGHPFPMGPVEFYDLIKDPGETVNLGQAENPVLRRLLAEASRYLQDALAPRRERAKRGGIELSEEERREADEVLRSLGYIR